MPEIITMALFCAALIGCIATGISIIPALVAGLAIFLPLVRFIFTREKLRWATGA